MFDMKSNWYWIQEFLGNGIATFAIGLFAVLFGGIATEGFTTFDSLFESWIMIPIMTLWFLSTATRLVDDIIRAEYNHEPHSDRYWLMEFAGDIIMLVGFAWMGMIVGSVNDIGYLTFIENNPWILWSEIPALVLMGIAVSLNWVNDIIRYKGR